MFGKTKIESDDQPPTDAERVIRAAGFVDSALHQLLVIQRAARDAGNGPLEFACVCAASRLIDVGPFVNRIANHLPTTPAST